MSPVYHGTLHGLTFTPAQGTGWDELASADIQPWVVIGEYVVHRTLGIIVRPTNEAYHEPDPERLCAALNRIYGKPPSGRPADAPRPESEPGSPS